MPAFNAKLIEWLAWYNLVRPHYALKQLSPIQFLQKQQKSGNGWDYIEPILSIPRAVRSVTAGQLRTHWKADNLRAMPVMFGSRNRHLRNIPGAVCHTTAWTPHTSGSTLSAQVRYAAGVREMLEC